MVREQLREVGIIALVILILFSAVVVLFFAEGGEIRGINHDPNGPAKPLVHSKYVIEVVEEEIVPIYDGREIKTVELWELPPKEIIRHLIAAPTAYIPPITGQLITFFISALGFGFAFLYLQDTGRKNQNEINRPEKILAYITKNPGESMQQIAAGTEIPRSSLRYHVNKMQKAGQISQKEYCGNPHYFSLEKSYSATERLVLAVFSRENEKQVLVELLKHPESTRQDLAERLHMSEITVHWYLHRLDAAELLMVHAEGGRNHYQLTGEAEKACGKFLEMEAAAQAK
ncbi:winged helix-turn-helix transcriptional regulator [Methanorbis furvi]|uniref:HTH arsR-type domain-containing protein n=1 Tax=Methanorbis furvi TaxID=3028299 RepID=A0AAE4MB41_9EURY|nr:hypothetical protein [Methanocorpusculaceae archaeon Ag1]